ncbi:MAG: signal peptidase II [Pseudomonadota bacterium]|nr:signal peptidase II [Pseudomonadota bacterium]
MMKNFTLGLRWKNLFWLLISAVIIVLDQWSKLAVADQFVLYESRPVTDFFNLVLVHNHGAAFSFLADAGGWQRIFFSAVAIIVSMVLVVWLCRLSEKERVLAIALPLVIGGAIGNLIDRLAYGYVIDFLDFYVGSYHWPAFNVADIAVSTGAFLLFVDALFLQQSEQK